MRGLAAPPAPPPGGDPAHDPADAEADAERGGRFTTRQVLLAVGLSVAALAAVAWWTYQPGALARAAEEVDPGVLALLPLLIGLRLLFGGWRLRLIGGGRLTFLDGVRGQLAWDFFSTVTPSAAGGGPIAAVYVARANGITVGEGASILLFSMLSDQVWFATLVPVLALLAWNGWAVLPEALGPYGQFTVWAAFTGMVAWATAFAYGVLVRPDLLARWAAAASKLPFLRRFGRRIVREVVGWRQHARTLGRRSWAFYLAGYAAAGGFWTTRYLLLYVLAKSLEPAVSAVLFLARAVSLYLGSMFVPTPGGSGGVEGLFLVFFGPLLPDWAEAPVLLGWRAVELHFFIAVGLVLMAVTARRLMRR